MNWRRWRYRTFRPKTSKKNATLASNATLQRINHLLRAHACVERYRAAIRPVARRSRASRSCDCPPQRDPFLNDVDELSLHTQASILGVSAVAGAARHRARSGVRVDLIDISSVNGAAQRGAVHAHRLCQDARIKHFVALLHRCQSDWLQMSFRPVGSQYTLATGPQRLEDLTRRAAFGRVPRRGFVGAQSTGIHHKPRFVQVHGNVWDHGRPAREHTPNCLQSHQTMPALSQRVARLADADARV